VDELARSRGAVQAAMATKLAECLAFLREGDVLTVTKPERLARSTAELLSIEADLSKRGISGWTPATRPASSC
jgi:DNA invertase Pin-like site-specific DNA recombinase